MTGNKIDWRARRDGFDHGRDKPTSTPINWRYWGSLQDWKQWEACALSLNINPHEMKRHPQGWMAGPGSAPIFTSESFPNRGAQAEFDKRLTMFNRVARGNPLKVVSPAVFAAWCVHVGLTEVPSELLAMAATLPPAAPESAPAQNTAAPAPVVAAIDGPAPLNTTIHSTKARRDTLTPVIELAQSKCRNPQDTAEVWAALQVLAETKTAPLIGGTEDGLQYLKGGIAEIFTRKSLGKRLAR